MSFKDLRETYNYSLVALGQFNPAIFQPKWLTEKGLIGASEGEDADIDVIHPSISRFKLDWANFEITSDKMMISTTNEGMFNSLNDIMKSIFRYFKEIPVTALGINHIMHFDLAGKDDLIYNFGDKLAPLSTWDDILKDPRMLCLEMVETERKDDLDGRYRIRIIPSEKLKQGIEININDHYNVSDGASLAKILESQSDTSYNRAEETIEKIYKIVKP